MMTKAVGTPVIGTDVLFENERAKVWDFVREPGELKEPRAGDR
jgi:hypothetical protein